MLNLSEVHQKFSAIKATEIAEKVHHRNIVKEEQRDYVISRYPQILVKLAQAIETDPCPAIGCWFATIFLNKAPNLTHQEVIDILEGCINPDTDTGSHMELKLDCTIKLITPTIGKKRIVTAVLKLIDS